MSEWSANNAATEAARIWAIFSGMYGTRLTRDFGESVPEVWKQAVGTLKRHELERGLRRLTSGGSGSPPTLPQFMKACKTIGDDHGGEALPGPYRALPHPDICEWTATANRNLFGYLLGGYLREEPPCSNERLALLIAAKNQIANDFRQIASECEVKDGEVHAACQKAFAKIAEPSELAA